jgi:hypothetical protein
MLRRAPGTSGAANAPAADTAASARAASAGPRARAPPERPFWHGIFAFQQYIRRLDAETGMTSTLAHAARPERAEERTGDARVQTEADEHEAAQHSGPLGWQGALAPDATGPNDLMDGFESDDDCERSAEHDAPLHTGVGSPDPSTPIHLMESMGYISDDDLAPVNLVCADDDAPAPAPVEQHGDPAESTTALPEHAGCASKSGSGRGSGSGSGSDSGSSAPQISAVHTAAAGGADKAPDFHMPEGWENDFVFTDSIMDEDETDEPSAAAGASKGRAPSKSGVRLPGKRKQELAAIKISEADKLKIEKFIEYCKQNLHEIEHTSAGKAGRKGHKYTFLEEKTFQHLVISASQGKLDREIQWKRTHLLSTRNRNILHCSCGNLQAQGGGKLHERHRADSCSRK